MVAETTPAASRFLVVPRARAAAQIEALGLPRNTLGDAFDLPEGGAVSDSWQTYGPQEQAALPLLAAPAIVARIRAVFEDGHALATWAVTGTGTDPALTPYLLLAHDEKQDAFRIQPVPDRATLVRTFLAYLDLGLPAPVGSGFHLPVGAFTLLMALCDLYRRARSASELDHAAVLRKFAASDVNLALEDGRKNRDPRWLLPHLLAIRPDLPAAAGWEHWLPVLTAAGWLEGGGEPVALGEAGVRLAQDLDRPLALVSFWVAGATAQGELASRSALFVRSPWNIWCFDVGGEDGDTVIGAPVDVAAGYGLLEDLLTPVGVPQAIEAAPPAPKPPAGRRFCPNCGQPINPGARFCGHCGQTQL